MRAARLVRKAARFLGIDPDVLLGRGRDQVMAHSRLGPILFCAGLNAAIWVGAIALECAAINVEASGLVLMSCGVVVMTLGAFGLAIVTSDRR